MDLLSYLKVFEEVSIKLFEQWDHIETVATNFIKMVESISLALIEKMK